MADQAPPADETINLVNPSGQLVSIPRSQIQSAKSFGYRAPTEAENSDFISREKYGKGLGNELAAGALGAAGSASFGLIPEALAQTGLVKPETQAALAKYNPISRGVGQAAGIAGGIAGSILTGGASTAAEAAAEPFGLMDALNPISGVGKVGRVVSRAAAKILPSPESASFAKAILSRAGAAAAGSAAEGGLFGLGQSIDEHAMGDPDALGEHLLHNVGYGAALAALAGGGISVGGDLFGALKGAVKDWKSPEAKAAAYKAGIQSGADHEAQVLATGEGMPEAPTPPSGPPSSLADIQEKVKSASYQGITPGELPAKKALVDAMNVAGDLEYPVHNAQLESLSNERGRNYYKAQLETQSDEAQAIKSYEALQKRELTGKLASEVQNIAPTESLTSDATKGGEGLVKAFTDHYQAEKDTLAPAFKAFDEAGVKAIENPHDLIDIVQKAIPGAGDYIKVSADKAELLPYKASMPFSRTAYNAIKDMVEAANDREMTLGGLRNVRESMRDSINWMSAPREAAQISALRKATMDYMEGQIARSGAEMPVREAFKRYAINEENRSTLERIFGGSISDKASFAKEIKSEDVLNKLFANSVSVKAAKDILPANVFNKAVGDYLSMQKAAVTDAAKNGFSSFKFATFLKNKEPELVAALSDNPQALAKMKAYTDIMRILPDSPSINPSGTAKTLNMLSVLNKVGSILHPMGAAKEMAGAGLQSFAKGVEERRVAEIMNQIMAGKSTEEAERIAEQRMAHQSVLGVVKKAFEKGQQAIEKGAKAIFMAAPAAAAVSTSEKAHDHQKVSQDLHSLNVNPANILERMDSQTKLLYASAPKSAAALNQSMIRATQFLSSKLPQTPPPTPLGPKFEPSKAEVAKFETYYNAVQKPLNTFGTIRDGTIVPESVEAIKTVYPKMYDQMRLEITNQLAEHVSQKKPIPYSMKLGLSLFMGEPMDGSMTPQAILSAQPKPSNPQQQGQAPQGGGASKPGKALSKLGKSAALYATSSQSREMERAKHST